MSARPRLALIGCGRIGRLHARALLAMSDRCELAAIADADGDVAEDFARHHTVPSWTDDAHQVIEDRSIDAIILASSTETHAPYIIAAAEASKDVFTEKPIALDLAATDRAIDSVKRANVRLQVGFQRRFDRGYAAARKAIEQGDLGRVEMIRDAMRDPEPPSRAYLERSGGLYRDMTIHNFDTVRWLMGAEPEEVYAVGSAVVDPMFAALHDIDTSIVTLRFGNGSLASIDNSRRSGFGYDVRTEVFGSNGALFIGRGQATPLLHLDRDGVHSDHLYWFMERFAQAYIDELRAFIDAIRHDQPVSVTGEDGRVALALAYAAEESRRTNRPVAVAEYQVAYSTPSRNLP